MAAKIGQVCPLGFQGRVGLGQTEEACGGMEGVLWVSGVGGV